MEGRILIVDDDEEILKVLSHYLTSSGYEVVTAMDAWEALQWADSLPLDLAIVDVLIPGIDGFEVCEYLRHHPPTEGLPIILLTSLDQTTDQVVAWKAGVDDYLTKPVDPRQLLKHVQILLTRVGKIRQAT